MRYVFLFIGFFTLVLAGCNDECGTRGAKCAGNIAVTCAPVSDTEISGHLEETSVDCGDKKCVATQEAGYEVAFCALDTAADPRCPVELKSRPGATGCVEDALVEWRYGYAVSERECDAGLCVTTPCEAVAVCRAAAVPLELCPAAPYYAYRCNDTELVTCTCGTAADSHPCATGTCAMTTTNGVETGVCE